MWRCSRLWIAERWHGCRWKFGGRRFEVGAYTSRSKSVCFLRPSCQGLEGLAQAPQGAGGRGLRLRRKMQLRHSGHCTRAWAMGCSGQSIKGTQTLIACGGVFLAAQREAVCGRCQSFPGRDGARRRRTWCTRESLASSNFCKKLRRCGYRFMAGSVLHACLLACLRHYCVLCEMYAHIHPRRTHPCAHTSFADRCNIRQRKQRCWPSG